MKAAHRPLSRLAVYGIGSEVWSSFTTGNVNAPPWRPSRESADAKNHQFLSAQGSLGYTSTTLGAMQTPQVIFWLPPCGILQPK